MVGAETAAARFWDFALGVYLPEAGRAAFLRLQDRDGADVPLLLFCLWCGADGLRLSDEAMAAAVSFSAEWRAARVEPLRRLRHEWKGAPDPLSQAARQQVAKAEQAVERLQMDHLASLRAGEAGAVDAFAVNIAALSRYVALILDPKDVAIIVSLATAFTLKGA